MTTIKTYSNFKKEGLIFSIKSPNKKLMRQARMVGARSMRKRV